MSIEKKVVASSGWLMLFVIIAGYLASVGMFVGGIVSSASPVALIVGSFTLLFVTLVLNIGLFSLQPGQARVCVLFGKYVGTVRDEGLHWANPFFARNLGSSGPRVEIGEEGAKISGRSIHSSKISTRVRTHNGERLKVNDRMGNPIEIATVVVWHVEDTAKALFDVDDYESFVDMQAETALRHVASIYAYDHMEDDDSGNTAITLRSNIEEVSEALRIELDNRLAPAGVDVDDARLTHLAYAPEIAQAMLRRQQAEAIIAARRKIVEGAVGMVDMAVEKLSEGGNIELDDERKAVMASNLMVVLCGESDAKPVLNAGSLY